MFLSNKQHTQLRTLVMDFEVPYRTYVANEIVDKYRTPGSFAVELTSREAQTSQYNAFSKFSSIYGKIKSNPNKIYEILKQDTIFSNKLERILNSYNIALNEEDIKVCLSSLEYLNKSNKALFGNFSLDASFVNIENELTRVLAYFIYRHCSEALDYEEFCALLFFAIVCTYLVASISNSDNIIERARTVSEEIEYSEENTQEIISLYTELI